MTAVDHRPAPAPGTPAWVRLCACGCGRPTPIAKQTKSAKGHVKGRPVRFIQGHGGRRGSVAVPLSERFWDRVDRRGPHECWPWMGSYQAGAMGYGCVAQGKTTYRAHRVAYTLANGPIPDGMLVRHSCDNPPCCNPAHLLVGTPADNMRDRSERDRAPKGEQVASHVLTAADVAFIREAVHTSTISGLARMFGVARSTIRHVRDGKTWKHVEVSR